MDLAALEERAAFSPNVESVSKLASAYVDHGQPGLACAVIERSDRSIQSDLAVADIHARALFHRGQPRQALAVVEDALATCEKNNASCRSWQASKARGQAAFLHEVVVAGIEDPMADPSALRAAYERSTKMVGLVAMR
jgi:Flp pilus assembly protein TadD